MYENELAGEILFTPLVNVSGLCVINFLKTSCFFFLSHFILPDLVSLQRSHVYLHDWCELAIHPANHLATHLRLHRANSGATEASDRGWWGDPEPCGWGEWGGRAGWEDTSHQATQNRWVLYFLSLFLFFIPVVFVSTGCCVNGFKDFRFSDSYN